jgi:hypothetical protein
MKPIEYYNSFIYRFTKPIKRLWFRFLLSQNVLIKVDDRHRGIGKTYMMIERAIKYDIPIVAGSQQHIDLIKRFGNPVDVYGLSPDFTSHIQKKQFPNGVMIDESLKPEMITWLKNRGINIRGGFIYNYRSDKQ